MLNKKKSRCKYAGVRKGSLLSLCFINCLITLYYKIESLLKIKYFTSLCTKCVIKPFFHKYIVKCIS